LADYKKHLLDFYQQQQQQLQLQLGHYLICYSWTSFTHVVKEVYLCRYLGGLFFLMYRLPFQESVMFGALISATDPVSVLAIFQVPNSLSLHNVKCSDCLLEGVRNFIIIVSDDVNAFSKQGKLEFIFFLGFAQFIFCGCESSHIKHCIRWISQELGTDVNLYALVFGESVLNDAVMPLQLSWSLRFNCSWALMFNVQVFGLGFRA
jgi:hypothetical protein